MNLETFKELLLKQQSSGLTVKAFCEQEHLSMSNWCYWKRKCTTPMQDALVPMQLHHKVIGGDQESIPASSNGGLNIHFPNGVRVEFGQSDNAVALQMLNTMCQRYVLPE